LIWYETVILKTYYLSIVNNIPCKFCWFYSFFKMNSTRFSKTKIFNKKHAVFFDMDVFMTHRKKPTVLRLVSDLLVDEVLPMPGDAVLQDLSCSLHQADPSRIIIVHPSHLPYNSITIILNF